MIDDAPPPPPFDDELPPPPPDMEQEVQDYPELKVKKSGPFATLRRAVTIFEKDLRTMAKHGLISSIIMAVFMGVVFTIASVLMSMALTFEFDGGGDGDEIRLPGATESIKPLADAGPDITVDAGTLVTLDASGSTDNAEIIYYAWNFQDSGRRVDLYGVSVTHTFMAAGTYWIDLTIVDSSWNMAEDNITVTVRSVGSDSTPPDARADIPMDVTAGTPVEFDGSMSTDDVGVVNWTWNFWDVVDRTLYGERPHYTFENVGSFWVSLVVRDAAGNTGETYIGVDVRPTGEDWSPPDARFNTKSIVTIGDTITLDASDSRDYEGTIVQYTWYVKHNATMFELNGPVASFVAEEWGPYEIRLAVRDASGNTGVSEAMVIALPAGIDVDMVSWTATPLGQDVSFNLLTYAYGTALLVSVSYIGGLFGKGFAHEIQKGTVKVLFFGPVSVTTIIFSKLLYPIIIGPMFIFPLVLVILSPFHQSAQDILVMTAVAYALVVLVMVSAAYGSCLLYRAANKMVLKPTVVSRTFMYLSLFATMTIFEWLSFMMDMQLKTDMWGDLYLQHGANVAMFSPFHQGGVLLSDLILGTGATPDWWVFAIPAALIVSGVLASRRLYPDLFSRE